LSCAIDIPHASQTTASADSSVPQCEQIGFASLISCASLTATGEGAQPSPVFSYG
jgi:hypothetical protein